VTTQTQTNHETSAATGRIYGLHARDALQQNKYKTRQTTMKTMEPLGNLKVNSSALVKFNKSKAKSYTAFK